MPGSFAARSNTPQSHAWSVFDAKVTVVRRPSFYSARTITVIQAAEPPASVSKTGHGPCYLREVFEPLIIDGLPMEPSVDDIVAALTEVIPVFVEIIDLDENQGHVRMLSSPRWFSGPVRTEDLRAGASGRGHDGRIVWTQINRRWILRIAARGVAAADSGIVTWRGAESLPLETLALIEDAARKLSRFLPANAPRFDVPPQRPGGGNSGSAELGIPVWWVRRARG
jgi:hypothetical protein